MLKNLDQSLTDENDRDRNELSRTKRGSDFSHNQHSIRISNSARVSTFWQRPTEKFLRHTGREKSGKPKLSGVIMAERRQLKHGVWTNNEKSVCAAALHTPRPRPRPQPRPAHGLFPH